MPTTAACSTWRATPAQEAKMRAVVERLALPTDHLRFVGVDEAAELAGCAVANGGWWFAGSGWVQPPSLCAASLEAAGATRARALRPAPWRGSGTTAAPGTRIGPDGSTIASAPGGDPRARHRHRRLRAGQPAGGERARPGHPSACRRGQRAPGGDVPRRLREPGRGRPALRRRHLRGGRPRPRPAPRRTTPRTCSASTPCCRASSPPWARTSTPPGSGAGWASAPPRPTACR